jgi:thioredoxin reductase (NADPH)
MSKKIHDVIIIGGGPAGLTAALYASRAQLNPILIEGPEPGGQLTTTTDVENFPGFPDGILGPDLVNNMHKQSEKFGTEFITGNVSSVKKEKDLITFSVNNENYATRTLILATGASARLLGLDSEKRLMGRGASTCATCDGFFYREKTVAVIGGGDSACEEALFLTKFATKVTMIHRRDELRASKVMQERVFKNDKIEIIWDTGVEDFNGEKRLESVSLVNLKTEVRSKLYVDGAFLAIGHIPNTKFLEGLIETDEDGYIETRSPSSRTNVEGIFACGDVQDKKYKQAISAAGSGCIAALDAEHYLAELA